MTAWRQTEEAIEDAEVETTRSALESEAADEADAEAPSSPSLTKSTNSLNPRASTKLVWEPSTKHSKQSG